MNHPTHARRPLPTNRLNRRAFALTALTGSAVLGLAACGAGGSGSGYGDDTLIKVASHLPPMTDVVTTAAEAAQEEGYTVELVQVSDNVQYNRLLADGEVDANFAQHEPYMQAFNEENDADLVLLDKIYDAKVGFYSKDHDDVEQVPEGAKVALPNDASNEGRALAMLHDQGLITLPEDAGFEGRVDDIVDDPLGLEFVLFDSMYIPTSTHVVYIVQV